MQAIVPPRSTKAHTCPLNLPEERPAARLATPPPPLTRCFCSPTACGAGFLQLRRDAGHSPHVHGCCCWVCKEKDEVLARSPEEFPRRLQPLPRREQEPRLKLVLSGKRRQEKRARRPAPLTSEGGRTYWTRTRHFPANTAQPALRGHLPLQQLAANSLPREEEKEEGSVSSGIKAPTPLN